MSCLLQVLHDNITSKSHYKYITVIIMYHNYTSACYENCSKTTRGVFKIHDEI